MEKLKRQYTFQGMVQFDENKKLVICGTSVKWLDTISVKAFTERKATSLVFDILENEYPQYKDYIQLL